MINSHYLLGLPILQITEVLRVPQLSFRIHRIKPAHFCGELTHLTRRYRRAGCGRTLEGNPPPSQRAAAGTSSVRSTAAQGFARLRSQHPTLLPRRLG